MADFVIGKIFDNLQIDNRVTSDLDHCLYCVNEKRVLFKDLATDHLDIRTVEEPIRLNSVNDCSAQCPSCKRVYILR